MAKLELTDRNLKRLPALMAKAGLVPPVVFWDTAVPGLCVRVWKTGIIVWTFKGRVGGRQVMKRLGVWPDLGAEAARGQVLKWREDIRAGENPIPTRYKPMTWGAVLDQFEAEHLPTLKPKSRSCYQSVIRVHLRDAFAHRVTVQSIDYSDVRALYDSIVDAGKGRQANVALMLTKVIFDRCELWGYRPPNSNPVVMLKKGSFKPFPEKKRDRRLSDAELKRLGKALDAMELEGYGQFTAFVRVLLLSGIRRSEALALRWDCIDEEHKVIRWGDTKTGPASKPLNDALLSLLACIPRIEGVPWVFPTQGTKNESESGHLEDIKRPWKRLLELAELDDVTRHDLRHNLGNVATDEGLNLQTIAAILGHRDIRSTERYAKASRALSPADRVARKIQQKLRGSKK